LYCPFSLITQGIPTKDESQVPGEGESTLLAFFVQAIPLLEIPNPMPPDGRDPVYHISYLPESALKMTHGAWTSLSQAPAPPPERMGLWLSFIHRI
jgi:hypothetical protein